MRWVEYFESNFPRRFKCRECGEYFTVPVHFEPERDDKNRILCDECYDEFWLDEEIRRIEKK